jgi:hypothetical protein
VVNDIEELWLEGIDHQEDLSIGLILLFSADSVPEGKADEVRDPREGIFKDFNLSLGERMVVYEDIAEVGASKHLFCRQVDVEKLVEGYQSLVEECAINNNQRIVPESNLINIIAVKIGDIFDFDVVLDCDSGILIVDSKGDAAVGSIGDESNKAVVASDFGGHEIVGGAVLLLGDVVFLAHGNVVVVAAVDDEIISYFREEVPPKTSSRSNRSYSPTVIGICEGRGDTLQTGLGGFTQRAIEISKIKANIFINYISNHQF